MERKSPETSRKWHVLAAVSTGVLLSSIDGSIVNVALPTLMRAFNTEFAIVQWVVLSYLLCVTTLLVSMGRLGDMLGKKAVYVVGFVVFTLGSVLCGLAPSIYWLVGWRVLQAVGASMMMALGMAIVTEAFPPTERGKALGITGSVVSVGIMVGPVLGGLLVDALSWHWIFFVNLPVGIIGTLMVLRYVPQRKPTEKHRFDFGGALVLLGSLLSVMLGLTLGEQSGFSDPRILFLFAAGVILLLLFLYFESKVAEPVIDLGLFRDGAFSIGLATGFLTFVSIAGAIILMPFYLENVLGVGPRTVGLLMAIEPIALGITAPVAGALSDRLGSRPITAAGLVVLALGYFAVSTINADTSVLGYGLRFLPIGIGMGVFQSPNNSAIMGSAPRPRLGVASGLLSMSRTLGQSSGIAILGALWASRVFFHLGSVLPGGATEAPAAVQTAALKDTFLIIVGLMVVGLLIVLGGAARDWFKGKKDKDRP